MKLILIIFLSYLIGSIPFSYLFPKLRGVDPSKTGTGNVGASNVLVVAGPILSLLALIGDVGKGFLAVVLGRYFSLSDWGIIFCALAAVVGHDFSVFLKFKGGKGVATTVGVFLAIDPVFTFLALLFWFLALIVIRYFIPTTVLVLCFVPAMMWLFAWKFPYIVLGVLNALLGIYAHRADLRRFFAGEELTVQESLAKYLPKS